MNRNEAEKLVCASHKPDARFFEQAAGEMQMLGALKAAKALKPWDAHLFADSETIIKELARVVEADRQENANRNLPCEFEYQVIRASTPVDHLQVLTRFFKKGDPQSIFYGRFIARLESGEFALWIE